MLACALHISALGGVVALLVIPDSGGLALWSVVVTSIAGLIAQQMKAREDRQRDERRFRHDAAERMAAANARNELLLGLAENTALTRDAGAKADAAYEVSNHVNEKIASLARAGLIEREKTP